MSPPPSPLRQIAALLTEARMGFLALVAFGAGLAQIVFDLHPVTDVAFEVVEWAVVAVFAVDYLVTLRLSADWRAYAFSPWGLLDLVIITAPMLSLLPGMGSGLQSTPILRLLRLARAVMFGARAGRAAAVGEDEVAVAAAPIPFRVTRCWDGDRPVVTTLADVRARVGGDEAAWWHCSGGTVEELAEIAAAADVPMATIDLIRTETSYPRALAAGEWSGVFSWLPTVRSDQDRLTVDRQGVVLLTNGVTIVTFSRDELPLQEAAFDLPPTRQAGHLPFAERIPGAFLALVLQRNEQVAGELERAVRRLESLPFQDSSPTFFGNAFWMKRELSAARADLWRLKALIAGLADGRIIVRGVDAAGRQWLEPMAEDAEYLHETLDQMRESVLSIIELHVNIVSFEMNRFMRLLAVVSVLGLIPAVIGGLLGMNVAGNPWSVTLDQVAFGVSMAMLVCLYLFLVRGWLR